MVEDAHDRINALTERLHALEIDHVEIKGDVRSRVTRMEQKLEEFADAHAEQSVKLDTLLDMGRKRDNEVAEIKATVSSIAPHVTVIKDAMVIWRFFRLPAFALVGGLTTAAIGYFNPPAWVKNIFK